MKSFFPWNISDGEENLVHGQITENRMFSDLVHDAMQDWSRACELVRMDLYELAFYAPELQKRYQGTVIPDDSRAFVLGQKPELGWLHISDSFLIAMNVAARGFKIDTRIQVVMAREEVHLRMPDTQFLYACKRLSQGILQRFGHTLDLYDACNCLAKQVVWALEFYDRMMRIYDTCKSLSVFVAPWNAGMLPNARHGVRLAMGMSLYTPGKKVQRSLNRCLVPVESVGAFHCKELDDDGKVKSEFASLACESLTVAFPESRIVKDEFVTESRLCYYPESVVMDYLFVRVRLTSIQQQDLDRLCERYIRRFMDTPDDWASTLDGWHVDLAFHVSYRNWGMVCADSTNGNVVDWSNKKDSNVMYSVLTLQKVIGFVHESITPETEPRMHGYGIVPMYDMIPIGLDAMQEEEDAKYGELQRVGLSIYHTLRRPFLLGGHHTVTELIVRMENELQWRVMTRPDECRTVSENWPLLPYPMIYRYLTLSGEGHVAPGGDVASENADQRLHHESQIVNRVLMAREMPLMKRNCGMNRSLAETLLRHVSLEADCWQNNTRLMMRDHAKDYDKMMDDL